MSIFVQVWSCSPTDIDPKGPFVEMSFKFTDTDREIYFKDYDHFLETKPDSFFTGPYLINHDKERVELAPLEWFSKTNIPTKIVLPGPRDYAWHSAV